MLSFSFAFDLHFRTIKRVNTVKISKLATQKLFRK